MYTFFKILLWAVGALVVVLIGLAILGYVVEKRNIAQNPLLNYLKEQPNSSRPVTAVPTSLIRKIKEKYGMGNGDVFIPYESDVNELGAGYEQEDTQMYFVGFNKERFLIEDADVKTFEVNQTWPIYSRDAKHVFIYGKVIPEADPKTFVALCGNDLQLETFCGLGKDAATVFGFRFPIPKADPKTFVSLKTNNEDNKIGAGKAWTFASIDANAFYEGPFPSPYGNLDSPPVGQRVDVLSDASPVHFSDTSKVIAVGINHASWCDYHDGLQVGSKSYRDCWYLLDGNTVYTVYSICNASEKGVIDYQSCKLTLSKVNKVGDKPEGL